MKADEKRMTNFDGAETTVNETVDECIVQNVVGAKWKHVAIGGTAGIMMGVAGAVVGTEGAEGAETGMNGANHTPDATGVPVAASVNDEMSFGEAFAAARAEVGAGGIFEWRGNLYNTYYVQEWEAMTPEEREEFYEDAVHSSAEEQPVDVVDALETPETPETPESPVAPDATVVPVATAVNDDMSFNEAFAAARAEVGAGGIFEWHGNTYNTYYAEEWEAMSPEERNNFYAASEDVAIVQDVDVVEEDGDVRVIGVYEDNVEGHEVYIGAIEVDGENVMFVDVDHDQVFDIAVADVNGDGCISDEEVVDISDQGICVDDLAARAFIEDPNDLLAANDMPDYVNDADVSMC